MKAIVSVSIIAGFGPKGETLTRTRQEIFSDTDTLSAVRDWLLRQGETCSDITLSFSNKDDAPLPGTGIPPHSQKPDIKAPPQKTFENDPPF